MSKYGGDRISRFFFQIFVFKKQHHFTNELYKSLLNLQLFSYRSFLKTILLVIYTFTTILLENTYLLERTFNISPPERPVHVNLGFKNILMYSVNCKKHVTRSKYTKVRLKINYFNHNLTKCLHLQNHLAALLFLLCKDPKAFDELIYCEQSLTISYFIKSIKQLNRQF